MIYDYVWIAIIFLTWLIWTIRVMMMKKGMSWYGWWNEYASVWVVLHLGVLFISSLFVCIYHSMMK